MRQFILLGIMVVGALAAVYLTATVIEIAEKRRHVEYQSSFLPM